MQEDRLVASSEEAVFEWCVQWWEAGERPEAELLAVMKHVRFAAMAASFLHGAVRAWPALESKDGREIRLTSLIEGLSPAYRGALARSSRGGFLAYDGSEIEWWEIECSFSSPLSP